MIVRRRVFFYIAICFSFLLIPFFTKAQINTSSPYYRYGLGDIKSQGFSQSDAMGGIGFGLRNNKNLNILNPASYTALDSLTFTFEFGAKQQTIYRQTADLSETRTDANVSYLACGFPVTRWWYGSFGLLPYSVVGYNINETIGDSISNLYSGNGGINKFYIGSSFTILKKLSIGFNASYLFGTIDQSKTVRFVKPSMIADTTSIMMNLLAQNFITIGDIYLNFGMQFTDSINHKFRYTIGAVFDNQSKVNASRNTLATRFYNKGGSAIIDTVLNTEDNKGVILMPMNIGLGFSIKNNRWMFGADYYMQNWSKSEFFGVNEGLANSNSISVGSEFVPDKNSISKYWNKVSYRVGARYTNSYLIFSAKNEQIKDMAVSIGLGLPIKKTKSLINIAFELGQRGTTQKDLVKETYGIISVNFSLSDTWFVKNKFD